MIYVNGLYTYSPSLVNLFEGYNFDDARKKTVSKKTMVFQVSGRKLRWNQVVICFIPWKVEVDLQLLGGVY